MLDDSAPFLLRTGKKTGHVFERNQRNVERVAEADEPRTFRRRIDIEHAGQESRLVSDDSHRRAAQAGETYNKILREVLMNLHELTIVSYGADDVLYVVRLLRILRHQGIEQRSRAIPRVICRAPWRIVEIV